MRLTQGAMSIIVKRLLKLHMIKQMPLESDLRYNRLILTEKGKSMVKDYKDNLLKNMSTCLLDLILKNYYS